MGLEKSIPIPSEQSVKWESILSLLTSSGEKPIIRMIDGMPAFPDETPEENWKELRISLAGDMVTIRRTVSTLSCICWGTGTDSLTNALNRVVAACEQSMQGN